MAASLDRCCFAFVDFSLIALLLTLHATFLAVCVARRTPSRISRSPQTDTIYNFGDSISDTGNRLRELGSTAVIGRLPYGETFGKPTGRYSDGLLMIDYVARTTPGRISRRLQVDAVYNFGDSISDTGNRLRELGSTAVIGKLPYGETLGEATGRYSDGLLMIDYLAKSLNLPYLPPYLDKSANLDRGANFAVGGATALDRSFFLERGINVSFTNSSLSVQLQWFKTHLNSLCTSKKDCKGKLTRALFLVGEIGGNDINYALVGHKTIEEMKASYVPQVIGSIVNAAKELIDLGAIRLIVPGKFPSGCFPSYLTPPADAQTFDQVEGTCIGVLNEFARFYNGQLQVALDHLRQAHPGVTIDYADYYNAFLALLHGAIRYGFDQSSLFKSCCGVGGAYNYDPSRRCGAPAGVPVCPDPSSYISWDGVHLTQAAYKHMAAQIFGGLLNSQHQEDVAS